MKHQEISPIFLLTIIICFCTCSQESNEHRFIISKQTNVDTVGHKSWSYYSPYNFLLDTSGNLYIHNKDTVLQLDTGTDFYYPNWLDLKVTDIRKINIDTFKSIVDKEHNLPGTKKNSIQIASLTDTLKSTTILNLLDIMKEKNFKNFVVRLTTEEEKEVLTAKIENRNYDFYKIKWKSRFACQCFPPPSGNE